MEMTELVQYLKSWFEFFEFARYRNLLITSITICLFAIAFRYHGACSLLYPHIIGNRLFAALTGFGLMCFAIPLLTIPILKSSDMFGLRIGNARRWLVDLLIAYLIILALILIFARGPAFMKMYPLYKPAGQNLSLFVKFELSMLVYMFGWEFLFRGYYLFAIKKEIPITAAIIIQMIPFAFLHIGKPELEAYSSVLAGIILGILAIRANSFVPCAILHFLASFTMDVVAIISQHSKI